jgi:signal transduction histidine kinase
VISPSSTFLANSSRLISTKTSWDFRPLSEVYTDFVTGPEAKKIDLESLVTDVIDSISSDISPHVGIKTPLSFVTSVIPFSQVLRNLISNSIKHRQSDSVNIMVNVEDHGEFYEFSVSDDGPGIPFESREKVFNMFTTLKPRDQVEGSGIGLAVVRKHVTRLGGRIWIEDAQPHGADIHFTWPKHVQNHSRGDA